MSNKAEKEDQLEGYLLFGVVGGGGYVGTRKTLGGGYNFCLVNTCKAGGWFTCNCLSTWALFSLNHQHNTFLL